MSADGAGRTWDWSDGARDLVVQEQPAIAVYVNPANAVVIRQAGAWNDDEDAWVWFSPDHALAVAEAIMAAAGLDATALAQRGTTTCGPTGPKDPTAAERQKRYRERHRNGEGRDDRNDRDVTETVTPRDGEAA